jgi:hypothetical protein
MNSQLSQIAQILMNKFPNRIMLSAHEIAMIQRLEEHHIPLMQITSWIDDIMQAGSYHKAEHVLKNIEIKAQRWQQQNLGNQYFQEKITFDQQLAALDKLINQFKRVALEQSEQRWQQLFDWMISRITELFHYAKEGNLVNLITQLQYIEDQARIQALDLLGESGVRQLIEEVEQRCKNEKFIRPQDFLMIKKNLSWKLLRERLNLPEFYLELHGGW